MKKYIFTLIISLGILLTPYYKPTIVYTCSGTEMFPTFYGCPFIYKSTSLATSLAFDFYFWRTLANLIIWMLILLLLRLILHKTILKHENKLVKYSYSAFKLIVTIYFLLMITIALKFEGYSLKSDIDFEKETKAWGMTCDGHLGLRE